MLCSSFSPSLWLGSAPVALSRAGAPPGFDGGDWLGLARGILGKRIRPPGITASPVVPLLTFGAFKLVGAQLTFVAFSAVLGVAPATGVFWVLRKRISAVDAALVVALVAACAGSGEAASWGGYPQLIALGALPVALALADRALDRADIRLAVIAGFVLVSIAFVSDFIFTMAALAAAAIAMFRLPALARLHGAARLMKLYFAFGAPLLLAVPLEARIAGVRRRCRTRSCRHIDDFSIRDRQDQLRLR